MALRMRQSLAELEEQFHDEVRADRRRSETLRRRALHRTRQRTIRRRRKRSSLRFWMLACSLALTAAGVAIGMFVSLYYLLS